MTSGLSLIRALAIDGSAGLAIEARDLIDHILTEAIVAQIILLLRRQFKDLSGSTHAIEDLLVRKACTSHGGYFVHGNEAVVVEIGRGSTKGFLWRGWVLLGSLDRGLGSCGVMPRQAVFVSTDEITTAGPNRATQKRAQQSVVLTADGGACRCTPDPADGGTLGTWRAWQLLTAAGGET